ncbi:hypothetical protein CLIB1444_10S01332 [[Candida] jaroonii]|uniref:Uncharacterized protein n=1 Tax=[Candida] jaroonii TaxID=467808 RepID=A0ACA9YCZ4_9ASCO|nr:hypothetical protein CLIB1444_10S01332 [[Candida] jaroonii]
MMAIPSNNNLRPKDELINDENERPPITTQEPLLNGAQVEIRTENPESKKVAPRSSELFRVGPQFSQPEVHEKVFNLSTGEEVKLNLYARIDRGFELTEDNIWLSYKRNYITLVTSFDIDGYDLNDFIGTKFYLNGKSTPKDESTITDLPPSKRRKFLRENRPEGELDEDEVEVRGSPVEISYFAIRLVARCSNDDVSITLVQHTSKRDKGPQYPPPILPSIPGSLPTHEIIKASTNKRSGSKVSTFNKMFMFDRNEYYTSCNIDSANDKSILKNYPSESIARVARFERIQFGTSIRNASTGKRFYNLCVELLGVVEDGASIQPILLASIASPDLVVRGRSPGNYKKKR